MKRVFLIAISILSLAALAGCSSDSDSDGAGDDSGASIRLVSPSQGAEIQANPPDDLVILDVRTKEEFDTGHLEGAAMIDFYSHDFADQLAELDRDVPYLIYCRSGNRSGQATSLMQELGFTDVADVDGGITAWAEAGLPVTGP